jgi:molybdenum cofactor cytidylyltransferase
MAVGLEVDLPEPGAADRPEVSLAAVILAGGASRRMGTAKALLPFRGETILDGLIRLYQPFCDVVIVVLGHTPDKIRAGIARAGDVQFAVNPDPERGQLSSLQCGLAMAPADALFTPVDYPAVQPATVARLVRSNAPVAAPSYQGRHGHPVLIRDHVRRELLALPADGVARDVIHRYGEVAEYIDVDDAAVCQDIDRMEDYERLVASHE